jgi:phosphohistidine phosphatase SixA
LLRVEASWQPNLDLVEPEGGHFMRFIFLRHASRDREAPGHDHEQPLSATGREEVEKVRNLMEQNELVATRCFTSAHAHARETAERLVSRANPVAPPVIQELASLTPHQAPDGLEAFLREAGAASFGPEEIVLVVGHEPRISRLVDQVARPRHPPPAYGEATCVFSDSLDQLRSGQGLIEWRGP